MSTVIAVSLYPAHKEVASAYSNLMEMFRTRGSFVYGRLYQMIEGPKYRHKIDVNDGFKMINTTPDSEDCLGVRATYLVKSGRSVAMDVLLYGRQFEGGRTLADNGPICVDVTVNDLARPLWELVRAGTEDVLQLNEYGMIFIEDSEDLFYNLCRCRPAAGDQGKIIHGAMYLEYGWPSPAESAMVYHADAVEVALDLARIYYDYQFGVRTPSLLAEEVDVWDYPIRHASKKPGKLRDARYYRQFDKPRGEGIMAFLSGLEWGRIKRFAEVSRQDILRWLKETDFTPLQVRCEVVDDQAAFLYTDPLSSLWRFYQLLYATMA